MFTDIHSHVLPGVDDGAQSYEEAVKILEMMAKQNINSLVLTPHFYSTNCSAPKIHKEHIEKAYNEFYPKAKSIIPNILLGHEVHYFSGISRCEEIKELTIANSEYILIELPMSNFGNDVADEILALNLNFGLKPILAHIERYVYADGFEEILKLIAENYVKAHINCECVIDKRFRKLALKLIDKRYVSFIATDTHSLSNRPPKMQEPFKIISKKLGETAVSYLQINAYNLYKTIEEKI